MYHVTFLLRQIKTNLGKNQNYYSKILASQLTIKNYHGFATTFPCSLGKKFLLNTEILKIQQNKKQLDVLYYTQEDFLPVDQQEQISV